MDTMRPANKFGRTNWDPINLPESEFQGRIQTLQKELQKSGLDILLNAFRTEFSASRSQREYSCLGSLHT